MSLPKPASEVPAGPRRTEVERLDRDIAVAVAAMDLAIDVGDWPRAAVWRSQEKLLLEQREQVLRAHILTLPGVQEWMDRSKDG